MIDIREEYFVRTVLEFVSRMADGEPMQKRLQAGNGMQVARDNWEQVRVPRPEGTPEWGVPPPSSR